MLFSRTSELLLQIVKPHLNSSDDFSPLVNSSQRRSVLHTSSWLSSTLFSSFSSPPNVFELVLAHLTSVPPVHFLLSPVEVTQLQTFLFRPVEAPFLSIMVFNIWWCYHSCVMYYHSILLDCWVLPVGPTFKHVWVAARSRLSRVRPNMPFKHARTTRVKLLRTEAFTLRSCCTWQTVTQRTCTERIGFTQRSVYREKVLHRESCHTKEPLDQESFTPSNVLHTEAFTQSSCYTEKLLHRAGLYTERLLQRDAFTQITWYPEKLLHRKFCHKEAVTQR